MPQEFNFDLGLPANPGIVDDRKVADELGIIYKSIRLLAAQIGGDNLLETIDFLSTSSSLGWTSLSSDSYISYRYLNLDTIWVSYYLSGTSTSTAASFELPTLAATAVYCPTGLAVDNSVTLAAPGQVVVAANSNLVNLYSDLAGAGWTASGTKTIAGQFIYRSA